MSTAVHGKRRQAAALQNDEYTIQTVRQFAMKLATYRHLLFFSVLVVGIQVAAAQEEKTPPKADKAKTAEKDAPESDAAEVDAPKSDVKSGAKTETKGKEKSKSTDSKEAPSKAGDPKDSSAGKAASAEFSAKLDEWKAILKEMRSVQQQHLTADATQAKVLEQQWRDLIAKGEAMLPELRAA